MSNENSRFVMYLVSSTSGVNDESLNQTLE